MPKAGGLYDQDYDTMRAITYVLVAWREREERERAKSEAEAKRRNK